MPSGRVSGRGRSPVPCRVAEPTRRCNPARTGGHSRPEARATGHGRFRRPARSRRTRPHPRRRLAGAGIRPVSVFELWGRLEDAVSGARLANGLDVHEEHAVRRATVGRHRFCAGKLRIGRARPCHAGTLRGVRPNRTNGCPFGRWTVRRRSLLERWARCRCRGRRRLYTAALRRRMVALVERRVATSGTESSASAELGLHRAALRDSRSKRKRNRTKHLRRGRQACLPNVLFELRQQRCTYGRA